MPALNELLSAASREAYDLTELSFQRENAPETTVGPIDLKSCLVERCCLTDCRFSGTGLQDVTFRDCDLSGCLFLDCGLRRVSFTDCRMLGVGFSGCLLRQCSLSGCLARYANFSGSTLRDCRLTDCNFSGGALSRTKCPGTAFTRCELTRCDMTGAELGGLDLTSCRLDGAVWSLNHLKNITVTPAQAVEFARLLGVHIQ